MNNLRYFTTVLALVNAGLNAKAATSTVSGTTPTGKTTTNKMIIGSD